MNKNSAAANFVGEYPALYKGERPKMKTEATPSLDSAFADTL
jgi:hypothetical protein